MSLLYLGWTVLSPFYTSGNGTFEIVSAAVHGGSAGTRLC